jgi:hypothetical protein
VREGEEVEFVSNECNLQWKILLRPETNEGSSLFGDLGLVLSHGSKAWEI